MAGYAQAPIANTGEKAPTPWCTAAYNSGTGVYEERMPQRQRLSVLSWEGLNFHDLERRPKSALTHAR